MWVLIWVGYCLDHDKWAREGECLSFSSSNLNIPEDIGLANKVPCVDIGNNFAVQIIYVLDVPYGYGHMHLK